jgi:predicted ribosome quality control (RQC) complex YloA/Tae2 family protein
MTLLRKRGSTFAAVAFVVLSSGCASAYYGALEQLGIEKRDILVDRIDDARDAQADAKEQFATALERYRSVVTFDGGDLEKTYDRLNREYERSEDRAQVVRDRIDSVEAVADDLFAEWEDELDEYADPELRRRSARLLSETRTQYREVLAAMHRAEQSMDPVLALFRDQVLFLRHNLNARAVASLESELDAIERATSALLVDMQNSIDEASAFIQAMEP